MDNPRKIFLQDKGESKHSADDAYDCSVRIRGYPLEK